MSFKNYKGSIKLGAGLTPSGEGYPLMQTCDIQADESGKRLDVLLTELASNTGSINLDTELAEQGKLIQEIKAALQEKKSGSKVDIQDGYWYIDDINTGIRAEGAVGATGKSAYEYAKDAGYTGTEKQFAERMADTDIVGSWLLVNNPDLTTLPDKNSEIEFISNGEKYKAIWPISMGDGICGLAYTLVDGGYITAYTNNPGHWPNDAHKTITVTVEPKDTEIGAWIRLNAEKMGAQSRSDARLKTKSKRLVDAINELNDQISEGGADGVGISKIEKTSTEGLVDTYTITLTNGSTATFTVTNGADGIIGEDGADGKSAYQIAVDNGFEGTEQEWLDSLVGADGKDGEKGEPGDPGADGSPGKDGEKGEKGDGLEIVTTTGTGSAYEAEVKGITELKAGVSFVMVPHTISISATPTLNVNGLGAKNIYRRSIASDPVYTGYYNIWLSALQPYRVMYSGSVWILVDLPKTRAIDLEGKVPVVNGGVPDTSLANVGKVLTTGALGHPVWQEPSGGEIDTSTLDTVDKIYRIETRYGDMEEVSDDGDGISWANYFAFVGDNEDVLSSGSVNFKIPLAAGDNVTFEVDEENQVVKINATESMLGEWEFNEELALAIFDASFSFVSNGNTYFGMKNTNSDWISLTYVTSEGTYTVYDDSWEDEAFKNMDILEEPPADVAAWIKANAKRKKVIGVDKIGYIDTWYDSMESVSDDGNGISWENQFAFVADEGELVSGKIFHKIPLVAGNNVEFEVDGECVKINATGGSGDTEQDITGTWVLNEEITSLPDGTYDLNFSSDGEDYQGLIFGNLGPPILVMRYVAATGSNTKVAYAFTDVASSGISPHWQTEAQRILNIKEEPDSIVANWIRANGKKQGGSNSGNAFEMPQIRFANSEGNNDAAHLYIDEETPLKLTVEIVGGGALKVGDALQVCRRREYQGSRANGFRKKHKLQRFAEYVVTEADLDKRYLTIPIYLTKKSFRGFFRDSIPSNGISPIYLRIRRPKGDMQNNDSGQTVNAEFSNVVTIWKSHWRGSGLIKLQ